MTQARILIVEDDPDTARMLESWLRACRHHLVGTAASGQEAITLADLVRPDLVLLGNTEQVLRQAQDERQVIDYVRGELVEPHSKPTCSALPLEHDLPGEPDGLETAIILLERFDIPVLYLTSSADEAFLEHSRMISPATCLARPFNERELGRAVQVVLERHALLRQLKASEARLAEAQAVAQTECGLGDRLRDHATATGEAAHCRSLHASEAAQPSSVLQTTMDRLQAEMARHRKTEASLLHSESRYRGLVEILPDSVFVVQGERIIYANPAAIRLAGVQNEQELLGKPVRELVDSDAMELFEQRRQAAFANQTANPLIAYSLARNDGSTIAVESRSFAFEHDERPALLIVMRDLTEHRRTEQAAERFRMALDSSPDAIFLIDPARMRFIDANETACNSLGYTRDELLALGPHDIKPHFNKASLSERFGQVLSGKPGAGTIQTVHRHRDGSTFPVEVNLRPFTAGESRLMVVVARDITTRQHAELQLKEANERFRQFAENINEMFWIRDLEEDRILYVSPAYETLFRKPVDSLYRNARAFLDSVHPDDLERVTSAFMWQREHRQGLELEYRIIVGDNVIRWLWVRTFPVRDEQGKVYRMAGIAEDTTRRREYEEQYQAMIQTSLDGFLALDTQGRIRDCNDAYSRKLGYSREELLQLSIADLDFNQSPEQAARQVQLIIERGHDRFETQHLHKNGRLINVEISIHYRPDSRGGRLLAFIHDISQRKQAERALHRSVARYRSILRVAPVGIGVLVHRVFQEVNEAMIVMSGYRAEELLGQSARMLYPTQADYDYVGTEKYRQIQMHGVGSVETRWRRKDGTIIDIYLASSPIVEGDLAQGVIFTAQDITATKQAEQARLAHEASQRNALVREVHHRIKNNLQGVTGLLRQHITGNPDIRPVLEAAIAQVNTVAVIHGLQSRLPHQELRLRELLLEVRNAAAAMAMASPAPAIRDTLTVDVWLDSGATVTIALILNELIYNAFKHGLHAGGAGVGIVLGGDDRLTTVSISNPGRPWPKNLDLTTGMGCGTGLDLIRTLLPRHGAQLNLYETSGMIYVELALSAPVIHATERAGSIQ